MHKLEKKLRDRGREETVKLMKNTKLSPLFEGLDIKRDDQGVDQLLSKTKIKWERSDDDDVQALSAWAEFLSYDKNLEALKASEKLFEHILKKYYPDNFDVNWIRLKTLEYMDQDESYQQKIHECVETMKSTIRNWLKQDPNHYVSRLYLRSLASFYKNKGDNYLRQGEYKQAREQYKRAIEIDPDNDEYQQADADIFNVIGNDYFRQGEYQQAIEQYELAIEVYPKEPVYHSNLTKARVGERFGVNALWSPRVTPIEVYVKIETGELQSTLSHHINEKMQERIRKTMGVRIPDISFRSNEFMIENSYSIMINEIPQHNVPILIPGNFRLYFGSAESLKSLGISAGTEIKQQNPQTGDEAISVKQKDWKRAERVGLELWGLIEYMKRDLETIIRKNLSKLLGHQEVMNMLEERLPEIYKHMKDTPGDLSTLTSVLKGLL